MTQKMEYEVKKITRAHMPNGALFLIHELFLPQTDETVWCIGDDEGCAITRQNFLQNRQVNYEDVLIYENVYKTATSDSPGKWQPVIMEMVNCMAKNYIEKYGLVHVYPHWIPYEVVFNFNEEIQNLILKDCEYIILRDNYTMEFIFKDDKKA